MRDVSWSDEIRRRLAGAGLRPERESEIVLEIAQHLDDRYRDGLSRGLTAGDATAAAWRELETAGVLEREVARVERPAPPLPPLGAPARGSAWRALGQDLRDSVRRLLKQPLFAMTAILTVALSVGPATAILGISDELFFHQPPGVQAPDRLIAIQFGRPSGPTSFSPWFVSYANVADVASGATTFTGMTGIQSASAGLSVNGVVPRQTDGQSVKANFFDVLGVRMAAGRGFLAEEDATPGGVTSIVLAEPFARSLFGSPEAAIGQPVQLNSVSFHVVGVTAAGFEGAGGTGEFWIPGRANKRVRHFAPELWPDAVNRGPFYNYLVRLAPGVSFEAAEAEIRTRIAGLASMDRKDADLFKTINMRVLPGFGAPKGLNAIAVEIVSLLGVVVAVLVLLGIANMANLLIFRALKVGREMAIRKALGASLGRLIQMTLVESVMLALAGAAAGVAIALGIQAGLSGISVRGIGTITVPINWRVLGATAGLAVITGISFGLAPAFLVTRGSHLAALGRGLRTEPMRIGFLRQSLAGLQLALSLVLLVGALLFLTTLRQIGSVALGFDSSNITAMRLDLKSHGYDTPRMFDFYARLIETMKRQPGIDSAAIAYELPMQGGSYHSALRLPGTDPKSAPEILFNYVSSGFFDVLRIPVLQGRGFLPEESFATRQPSTIVLSAAAARALFGDASPIGRVVVEGTRQPREYTVVGIVGDVHVRNATTPPDPVAYQPFYDGLSTSSTQVITRSARPTSEVVQVIRSSAAGINPATPPYRDQTMQAIIAARLSQQRLFASVLGLLGAIGFFLAAIGLHGLMSQVVAERSREFGIRVALGATRGGVIRLVLRQVAIVAMAGTAVGLVTAALTGKLIERNLFGVTARDPLVYGAATGLLLMVVLAAVIGPVRRAIGIEPIKTLRTE